TIRALIRFRMVLTCNWIAVLLADDLFLPKTRLIERLEISYSFFSSSSPYLHFLRPEAMGPPISILPFRGIHGQEQWERRICGKSALGGFQSRRKCPFLDFGDFLLPP